MSFTNSIALSLGKLPPELAHNLAIMALRLRLSPGARWQPAANLQTELCGWRLPHPLGLAAGFDKNALAVRALLALGFSSVEVGAVTVKPQTGNAKPRLWRLAEHQALVNSMGFNNRGIAHMRQRLARLPAGTPVAVNIGVNKDSSDPSVDLRAGLQAFASQACFVSLNLSSPNTSGLRAWLQSDKLGQLLTQLQPLPANCLLKLSPEQSDAELADVVALAQRYQLAGFIVSNSSAALRKSHAANLPGGLSGKPLMARSTDLLRQVYQHTGGKMLLVGCGGISDVDSAWNKIINGASYLQIYSAFVFQGPAVIESLCTGLSERLQSHGYQSISDAVGQGV